MVINLGVDPCAPAINFAKTSRGQTEREDTKWPATLCLSRQRIEHLVVVGDYRRY
jgi:hypothetical protein